MMNPEVYEKTRQLVRALNVFVVHVFIYFLANISLSIFTFQDIGSRWGWLFLIVCWAVALIYHGIRVYGIDPVSPKSRFLGVLFNTMGV